MNKKSQKGLQPKGKAEQSLSEDAVNALEKSLRMAAGGYYETYLEKAESERTTWLTSGPPGIRRRLGVIGDLFLPRSKHGKQSQ